MNGQKVLPNPQTSAWDWPIMDDVYTVRHVSEYRVVGMRRRPRVSEVYSEAEYGSDALRKARSAQRARGGIIQTRVVKVGGWIDEDRDGAF